MKEKAFIYEGSTLGGSESRKPARSLVGPDLVVPEVTGAGTILRGPRCC